MLPTDEKLDGIAQFEHTVYQDTPYVVISLCQAAKMFTSEESSIKESLEFLSFSWIPRRHIFRGLLLEDHSFFSMFSMIVDGAFFVSNDIFPVWVKF